MAEIDKKEFLDLAGTMVLVNQIKDRPTKKEVDNAISSSLGNVDLSAYAKAADLANKQDKISDLDNIRANATNGNTAYGWGNHANAGYAKASEVASNYQTKGDYPTKSEMQQAIADAQLEGEDVDLSAYATKEEVARDYQPKGEYLTATDITGKADKTTVDDHIGDTTVHVTSTDKTNWNKKQDAIEDLDTIRSNAEAGKTAAEWGNHANAGYAKTADVANEYLKKADAANTYPTKSEMQQAITDAIGVLRTELQDKLQELYDSITSVDSQAISDTLKPVKK